MIKDAYDPLRPLVIRDTNLSKAWSAALLHILRNPGTEIKPLLISLYGFNENAEPYESQHIREALDKFLDGSAGCYSVDIVAFTIFPQRYLKMARGDRHRFYQICGDALPLIKTQNPIANRRGLYFERLMFFGANCKCGGNQLEFIISKHRPGRRVSMYQASVFDPVRDHVNDARLGFPCMQHVSFIPTDHGLILNAFYATQLVVERCYGNLLGLCHLGAFMAKQLNVRLAQVNMFVGRERLHPSKGSMAGIRKSIERTF